MLTSATLPASHFNNPALQPPTQTKIEMASRQPFEPPTGSDSPLSTAGGGSRAHENPHGNEYIDPKGNTAVRTELPKALQQLNQRD